MELGQRCEGQPVAESKGCRDVGWPVFGLGKQRGEKTRIGIEC